MRVALHACCGPCLLEPLDALVDDGHEIVVVFANPNIAPAEEWERRRVTLIAWAAEKGLDVVETAYMPQVWAEATSDAASKEERCRACYRVRAGLVARWAHNAGFDAVATTLTVSPYQDIDGIEEAMRAAAAEYGLEYVGADYRERYAEATRRSRDLGMYRQNYCGCGPSQAEAAADREARKAARRASR